MINNISRYFKNHDKHWIGKKKKIIASLSCLIKKLPLLSSREPVTYL